MPRAATEAEGLARRVREAIGNHQALAELLVGCLIGLRQLTAFDQLPPQPCCAVRAVQTRCRGLPHSIPLAAGSLWCLVLDW